MTSYLPISNLSFTSELLESAVHAQQLIHLNESELPPSVQSDFWAGMDKGQITLLGMYDLSAAFDTVDHAILLRRLEVSFGIRGVTLDWFACYLSGRSQQISVYDTLALSTFLGFFSGFWARTGSLSSVYCRPCYLDLWSVCICIRMLMICRFTDIFVLGSNTLHCSVSGVAQILLVNGCLLIGWNSSHRQLSWFA